MSCEPIEIRITKHKNANAKWEYSYYGDRTPSPNAGGYHYYQHAKFRLPSGKAKFERFSIDFTEEQILAWIQKKYSNFKFELLTNGQNPETETQSKQ